MSFVIGTVLAFTFLEWPWRGLVLVPLAAFELFEVWLFLKLRGIRSITGPESLVGTTGVAVTDCRPRGQVKVRGQMWTATCPAGVDRGDAIVVTQVEGIRLEVAPR